LDDPLLERLRRALAPEFEVDRRLAAGGMGIVYRAREVALDRPVAVKVLRPELATAVARERFLREARLLARLQHPNVVPVHRADERDGLPFYVMDLIEGRTLADRLSGGPLPADDLIRLSRDLLEALAASHAAGVIHRDVKPHNIFLVDSRALLGDFGISHDAASEDSSFTAEGALLGTREYMAPEQLRGEPATQHADQYSAAAVLFEAACGRQWKALDAPARANWRGVPDALARVLRQALAVRPEERWPSMRAMRVALEKQRHRRRRQAVNAALAVGALLLALKGWTTVFPPPPPANHRALAIIPFTTNGATEDSLGYLVAEATYANLYNFPALTRVALDSSSSWRRTHPAADEASARQALDVERVITGEVERRGTGMTLRLRVTDSTGTMPLPTIEVSGENANFWALGDSAAVAIGLNLGRRLGTDDRNLASRSSEAIGQFGQGEARFEEDAWRAAADRYAAAVEADSTFVLARWRQLVARIWSRDFSWDSATALGDCCADQLPALEAGLVRALSTTDLPRRFDAFDSLHHRYSDDGMLSLLYASDLFHRGPLIGRGLPESLRMFQAAIESSPGGTPAPAYDHMVWGKTRLGERAEARRWLKARKRLTTDAEGREIAQFLQLGYDLRWVYWRAKLKLWLLGRFESDATVKKLGNFYRFSATWDIPRGQDAVGAVIASRLLDTDRASGLEAQALARLTWGRLPEGLRLIDSAALYFKSDEAELQRHQWRLLLPVLGAGSFGAEEEASARRWLTGQAAEERNGTRARWTLALDALQRGDTVAVLGWTDALSRIGASDSASARMAVLVRAMLDGGRDPRGALAATEPLRRFDSPRPGQDIFTRSLLHLSRARWFEAAGDLEGARREILWYENSDTYKFPVQEAQKMEVDAVASVAARVTRARLLLDAGESAVACRMLSRVRELWGKADSSLDAARARADSLFREGCR